MKQFFDISDSDAQQTTFTGRDLLRLVFKHKYLIFSTHIMITIAIAAGMFSLPPVYTSSGKVLVKTEQQGNPDFFSGVAAYDKQQASDPVNRKMETEMELVEARPIAEQVVRELNLTYWDIYHKPYVHLLAPVADLYDQIMEDYLGLSPDPEKRGFSDTVTALIKSMQVSPVKTKSSETTSNLIQISLKAPSDELVTNNLQKIMEIFIGHDSEIKQKAGKEAYAIVSAQTESAYKLLREAQDTLKKFLADSSYDVSKGNTLSTARDNETIVLLKEQLLEKQLELIEARELYRADSEKVLKLEKSINKLKLRVSDEVSHSAETNNRLLVLEREVSLAEKQYLDLKRRLSQISLYLDMNAQYLSNRIIVEPAVMPRESSWKKDVVLTILGSFAGLAFGFGLAGLREYADHTVSSIGEVNRLYGIEVLGTVNKLDKKTIQASLNPENII